METRLVEMILTYFNPKEINLKYSIPKAMQNRKENLCKYREMYVFQQPNGEKALNCK